VRHSCQSARHPTAKQLDNPGRFSWGEEQEEQEEQEEAEAKQKQEKKQKQATAL
jgi:hypothetical protein